MMKKLFFKTFLVANLFILPVFNQTAFADGWTGWSSFSQENNFSLVSRPYPNHIMINGWTVSVVDDPSTADVETEPTGCSTYMNPRLILEPVTGFTAPPNGKELYTMLLTAALTGRQVRLYINACWAGDPQISRVEMK